MKVPSNISYQIIINAYLREVEDTWSIVEKEHIDIPFSKYFDDKVTITQWVHIDLKQQSLEILIPVLYWSHTLRHQFAFPILSRNKSQDQWHTLELCHFVSSVMREETFKTTTSNKQHTAKLNTLIFRCLDSEKNTQTFLDFRHNDILKMHNGDKQSFIESEQNLLIGHQLHPVSKSRDGFSSTDMMKYSPETCGDFQLHYFAVSKSIVHQDSALADNTSDLIKQQLSLELERSNTPKAGLLLYFELEDYSLIPVHPWQASYLREDNLVKDLEQDGRIKYLGPLGEKFTATTSIRTVFNEHCPFMYKFSLNIRITNSERVNKSWELDRVVESARMMSLPIANEIQESAPFFKIVDEPAYISIKVDGKVLDGFSCILRDAKDFIDPSRDISSITSLVQDNPLGGPNRLANIIKAIADKENEDINNVALKWFDHYLQVSIESLMTLFVEWGLCFEPHGQNVLIEMDNGYPSRCFCRDGQGFFHREAAHEDWCKIIPNKGEATESIFPEDLACERLIYYPFVNQVFSIINALGTQGLADEKQLINSLNNRMESLNNKDTRYPFTLLEVLKNSERLPCKGNLLTQLYDMDELVGDIETQSIYVTLPNIYHDAIS